MTINEFYSFVEGGYRVGLVAPGLRLPPSRVNQIRHHALLGHGLALRAIRARARPGTKVGPAENLWICLPVIEASEHVAAAERATRELNAGYLTAILEGRYLDSFLTAAGADAPRFTPEEMALIAGPVNFVGINVYSPNNYVRAIDAEPGYEVVPFPKTFPTMATEQALVGPEALFWGPRHLAKLWNVREIYVTENGCPAGDVLTDDGRVDDVNRVVFLRNYLTQLQRATSEGVPVRGYFHWSLLDNFEWTAGFARRFGLHYVDYATLARTPKLSAAFYREVIARNGLA